MASFGTFGYLRECSSGGARWYVLDATEFKLSGMDKVSGAPFVVCLMIQLFGFRTPSLKKLFRFRAPFRSGQL